MAIEQQGGFWFGTAAADAGGFLEAFLCRDDWAFTHSPLKGHSDQGRWLSPPWILTCCCTSEVYRLRTDDTARIHGCVCAGCGLEQRFVPDMGQGNVEQDSVFFSECECGSELVNIASGLFLPVGSASPLALVAVRCTNCDHLECLAVCEAATSPSATALPAESFWRPAEPRRCT